MLANNTLSKQDCVNALAAGSDDRATYTVRGSNDAVVIFDSPTSVPHHRPVKDRTAAA